METLNESRSVETPHLVGALLHDGTARLVRAGSRKEAVEVAALLRSGVFGPPVAVCFGETRAGDGTDLDATRGPRSSCATSRATPPSTDPPSQEFRVRSRPRKRDGSGR